MAKPAPEASGLPRINTILTGTEINGEIKSDSDIRFDGLLTGNLITKGKLVMGETGVIKGEIKCKNAIISGKIEGKITVDELLTLKASSNIEGDIIANKLAIEPGSKFTGTCNMNNANNMGLGNAIKEEPKKVK